jgi:hypothetical protein
MDKKTVELTWERAIAYLKASYATEFSTKIKIEKTSFTPCISLTGESGINFAYAQGLIVIGKSEFISAILFPDDGQMMLVYFDERRNMERQVTVNFLNKYLPEIDSAIASQEGHFVDRTYENSPEDAQVIVTLADGYTERFWLMGLTDAEYIERAIAIREMDAIRELEANKKGD